MAIFGDRFNVRVVDCDLVATGFGGQRQLFVSVERNHTRQTPGPVQRLARYQRQRVEHRQHSSAHANYAQDSVRSARQRRGYSGFHGAINLDRKNCKDPVAGGKGDDVAKIRIGNNPARLCARIFPVR